MRTVFFRQKSWFMIRALHTWLQFVVFKFASLLCCSKRNLESLQPFWRSHTSIVSRWKRSDNDSASRRSRSSIHGVMLFHPDKWLKIKWSDGTLLITGRCSSCTKGPFFLKSVTSGVASGATIIQHIGQVRFISGSAIRRRKETSMFKKSLSSRWFEPMWKICVKLGSSSQGWGVKLEYMWSFTT